MGATRLVMVGAALMIAAAATAQLEFENIGAPVRETGHGLLLATPHPDGHYIAWATHATPDFMGLLGVRLDTGEVMRVPLSMFGQSHVTLVHGADGGIYAYCGSPAAHFVRYDVGSGEVRDLGAPADNAHYFSSGIGAMSPAGRFYVGTYPRATLVWVDTHTGETGAAGPLTDDRRNSYVWPAVAVSDERIVYCPVGLHHQELYAWDPATGEATQILPEEMTTRPGSPRVWKAADGHVYGRSGDVSFRCTPTEIIPQESVPGAARQPVLAGEWTVGQIDHGGVVTLTNVETGEERALQTGYDGRPIRIYSVGTEWEGRIWGGTMFPARVFSLDPETGEMVDYGRKTAGTVQVYDIMGTPAGLLLGSYVAAYLDIWNPLAPEGERAPVTLPRGRYQERPIQWARGPDGHDYIGTVPIKGYVGGALGRVDVEAAEVTWWYNPVGDLSIMGVAPVPETGELLCGTSIQGGTSAIATETEAVVFLWNCAQEQVVHHDRPLPGARRYLAPARAETGAVYTLALSADGARQYVAYDPVRRRTLHVGDLPGRALRFPYLHEEPVGPEGLLIGLVDDAVFAISPADHSVQVLGRHPSIARAHGFMVTADGTLYYGSGPELWRCRLVPPAP